MTDTTDLLQDSGDAAAAPQDSGDLPAAPRTRRRATSTGGGLAALVLPELKTLAAQLGISGVAGLRKSQLIEAIQERQASGGGASAPAATARPRPPRAATASAETADASAASDAPAASAPTGRAPRRAARPVSTPAAEPE